MKMLNYFFRATTLTILVIFCTLVSPNKVQAQEAFLGEVRMFAGNFAPRGWAFCNGQLLAISDHNALFSLLGTTYGGDGRTSFGLPDLRGRVAIHSGNGPGLSNYRLGQKGGAESTALSGAAAAAGLGRTGNVSIPNGSFSPSVNNLQPYNTINFIIALEGIYPSRS